MLLGKGFSLIKGIYQITLTNQKKKMRNLARLEKIKTYYDEQSKLSGLKL